MATKQGSVDLLSDPVAQEMLQSQVPARLAYNWTDGTPRVIPIWFHWNGSQIVLGTPADAPKMKALTDGSKVAITIDSDTFPTKCFSYVAPSALMLWMGSRPSTPPPDGG